MTSLKRARLWRVRVLVWRIGTGRREAGELAMANFGRRNASLIRVNQLALAVKCES
jgi:hypothetical protein